MTRPIACALPLLLLLLQAALLLPLGGPSSISLVQCSSSYIDDYFLPSAKIALNKIQQQFTPITAPDSRPSSAVVATVAPTAGNSSSGSTSGTTATSRPSEPVASSSSQSEPIEPNRSEFVNLELGAPAQTERAEQTGGQWESSSAGAPLVVSSTESVAVDASSSTQLSAGPPDSSGSEAPAESTTASESADTRAASSSPSTAAISNAIQAGPADEAVKATELEAVAAVEASIGFGDPLFGPAAPTDACYDEYGNARYCEPEFENIAFERQVEASSECGAPASRFCTTYLNEHGDQIRNCHICDRQHPKKRHPAAYLTDINNSNQPTCWVSAPIGAGQQAGGAEGPAPRDNVTLTLNFDKRYEITYVALQFCSLKPDSLAILKSNDFGASWSPYQFYSSQCGRVYGRPMASQAAPPAAAGQAEAAPIEATCLNSSAPAAGQLNGRLAFSALEAALRTNGSLAAGTGAPDRPGPLQDWISATNIRLVLDQHQASWIQSSLAHAHHHARAANATASAGEQAPPEPETSLTSPSDTYNYAISDLTVGGRCKCNGHASRCVHGQEGKLQCDCQHNTDGPDCERCLPLHHDRPWQRATQANANPCQPCNCNGHSRKCRFDSELYQLSGRRSGGVCIDCKDNTTGRHCHYCREGWTRDHTRPMSDKEACKLCDCHPVGSVGKVCNQTSGQCPCKEGVTGLECNRCAPGYQQSSSPSEPCIKLPENDINYEPSIEANEEAAGGVVHQISGDQVDQPLSEEAPAVAGAPTRAADDSSPASAAKEPSEPADPTPGPQMSRPRYPGPRAHLGAGNNQWRQAYARNNYLVKQHRHHEPLAAAEYADEEQAAYEPDDYQPPRRAQPYGAFHVAKQRAYLDPYRARPSLDQFGEPLASLEPGQADDYAPEPPHDSLYGPYERTNALAPSYADNSNTFNQIQATSELATVRKHRLHLPAGFAHQRPKQPAPRRSGAPGALEPLAGGYEQAGRQQQQRPPLPMASGKLLNCAECQSAMRKLNFKQKFCHLDYAIKATILSKRMANDWSRFEVEIQDIFKSPTSGAFVAPAGQAGAGAELAANNVTQLEPQAAAISAAQLHRALKVGGLQWVWIPTEDVACRCPRLRLHSTYLLMGLVDTRENSAASIQLDRLGVAVEWKSSLQDRMNKYQRRHSQGRC